MTDLSHLTGGPAHASRQVVLRARITKAPASETDSLHAIAINYTDVYDYEVPAGNWTPRGDALPAVGAECVLVVDDDGDAWVPTWEGASAFPDQRPQRVTSLPASPVDGQECYYVADATNGVIWHLRYNAGSASAYKWEVVGGGELHAQTVTGLEAVTDGATAHDPTTVDNGIVIPLAGDFIATYGALMDAALPEGNGQILQNVYNVTDAATTAIGFSNAVRSGNFTYGSASAKFTLTAGGRTIRTRYTTVAGAGRRQSPFLTIRPVRVG